MAWLFGEHGKKVDVCPVENGGTGNKSVDTNPTANSTKMVTSGGVYNRVPRVLACSDLPMPTSAGASFASSKTANKLPQKLVVNWSGTYYPLYLARVYIGGADSYADYISPSDIEYSIRITGTIWEEVTSSMYALNSFTLTGSPKIYGRNSGSNVKWSVAPYAVITTTENLVSDWPLG